MTHQRKIGFTLFVSAVILVIFACLAGRSLVNLIRGYLQPTIRVHGATILIVEAWLAPHILKAAKLEFDKGGYDILITAASGSDFRTGSDSSLNKSTTCRAANFLMNLGIDSAKVGCATDTSRSRHNTFTEAKAVKDWLNSATRTDVLVNVFTGNTHGRKSWVAFRRTLKGTATVGIISCPGWQSNGGLGPQSRTGKIRVLLKHGFGYLYALVWPVGWL